MVSQINLSSRKATEAVLTYLINPRDVSDEGLPHEAQDGQVEEEVDEEPSRGGMGVSAAQDDILVVVQIPVALLETLYNLEGEKTCFNKTTQVWQNIFARRFCG